MRLTVRNKILLGFGVVLLVVAGLGVASYRSLTHLIDTVGWVNHTYAVLQEVNGIVLGIKDAVLAERGFLLMGDQRYMPQLQTAQRETAERLKKLRSLTVDNSRQQNRISVVESDIAEENAVIRELLTNRNRKQQESAAQIALMERNGKLLETIFQQATAIQSEESSLLEARNAEATYSAHLTSYLIIYGGMLGLAFSALIAIKIQRSISHPLTEFKEFVAFVGGGDLTRKSDINTNDEVGDLASSLNHMVDGLKDVTGQARSAAQSLTSAVAQILSSTRQQAFSSAQQAAAVVQANATMQQISQSGLQISDRAKQVSGMAEGASRASMAGLEAVQNTDLSMEAIREQAEAVAENIVSLGGKTQTVGEIVATVNDIAEQSHLLALNAAIQAAAAGEHGRTFAVVASEIKNLADQSRDATVQVKSILGDIQKAINKSVMLTEEAVKRVESGKQQAKVAAGTIRGMNDSIQASVQAFQQIVAGTNQQQIGFDQVNQTFRDIGQASEQTAASTRQMESAATHLTVLGKQLSQAMDRYQV